MDRRVKLPLLLACVCAGVFVVLLTIAYGVGVARWADGAALQGFIGLQGDLVTPVAKRIAHLADPLPYALLGAALVVVALASRRPRHGLAVAALLGGSAVSSQLLQDLLAHPRHHEFLGLAQVNTEAFPSGHATASMALALSIVLVTPPAYRRLAAVAGGAFALGVSFSILTLGWHFPSDVVGGFLLAGMWCLLSVAALRTASERSSTRLVIDPRQARALIGASAIGAAVVVAPLLPRMADYAERHTAFAAVAASILVAAGALLATVAEATSRR